MTARPEHPATTAAPATITIKGTVSDPSGYPLAGVAIVLFDDTTPLGSTTTDDVGGYRFTRVSASAGAEHRIEATDETGAHIATSSRCTIGPGATTTHDATMAIAGYVQGTVTTQDGASPAQPATHVCVTAAVADTIHVAYVSATGRFRLGGLPAGTCTVTFEDSDRAETVAHSATVTVNAGRTTTVEDQVLRSLGAN